MISHRSHLLALGATALTAVAVTGLVRNFISGEKKIKKRIDHRYGVSDDQFERSMGQLLGPPILSGNLVTPLENGTEIFPAMLEAIGKAERTVCFETFIFWEGVIADRFAEALAAKARAGVRVHMLIDAVGCDCVGGSALRKMVEAGVELEVYHLANLTRANHRTHRKLLVIDGKLGFTGGVGIADEWMGDARTSEEWRDSHYRVEGPIVAQLQAAFLDNWMKTRAAVLHGEDFFPALREAGPHRCQIFKSSPMEGSESARLMFLLSITAAKHRILIGNAYFVPDDLTTETLQRAIRRGVSLKILVPGPYLDSKLVRGASRHRIGELLRSGAEIFEYQPTMYHCKCMVIDGVWTSLGSANFDNRSFRLNDEANLNVMDRDFAAGVERTLEGDFARARRVTYREWKNRPFLTKVADASASLFRTQL